MTREEAVEVIKDFVAYGKHVNAFVYKGSTAIPIEALNMAIEALEQEETLQNLTRPNKSDLISRQAAIDAVNKNRDSVFHDSVHYEDAVYDISNLPSAFAVEQKGEPMGDVISRRVVVECVYKALRTPPLKGTFTDTMSLAISMVNELPSAQPFTEEQIQTMQELESAQVEKAYELGKADRPPGHWIDTQVDSAGLAHRRVCSICGEEPAAWSSVNKFDFCPNCGARMESDEE